jgi:hypothetical protein
MKSVCLLSCPLFAATERTSLEEFDFHLLAAVVVVWQFGVCCSFGPPDPTDEVAI